MILLFVEQVKYKVSLIEAIRFKFKFADMRPKKRIANSKNYSEEVKQKKVLPGSRNDALKILKSICNSTAFKKDYIFAMLSQRFVVFLIIHK